MINNLTILFMIRFSHVLRFVFEWIFVLVFLSLRI